MARACLTTCPLPYHSTPSLTLHLSKVCYFPIILLVWFHGSLSSFPYRVSNTACLPMTKTSFHVAIYRHWWSETIQPCIVRFPWPFIHPRTDHVTVRHTLSVHRIFRPHWQFSTETLHPISIICKEIMYSESTSDRNRLAVHNNVCVLCFCLLVHSAM
jgi:hypothetical protein